MGKRLPLNFQPIWRGQIFTNKYPTIVDFISLARLVYSTNSSGNLIAMLRTSVRCERLFATGSGINMEETNEDNVALIGDVNTRKKTIDYYSASKEIVPTSEMIPWYMVIREFEYFLKVIFHFHLPGEKYIPGIELGILETEEERLSGREELGVEVIKTIKSYFAQYWQTKKPCSFPEIIAIKNHGYIILSNSLEEARRIYTRFTELLKEYEQCHQVKHHTTEYP